MAPVSYTHLDVYKRQMLYRSQTGKPLSELDHKFVQHMRVENPGMELSVPKMCIRDSLTRWKIKYIVKLKCIRARQLEIAAAQETLRGKYPGGVLKREGESSEDVYKRQFPRCPPHGK